MTENHNAPAMPRKRNKAPLIATAIMLSLGLLGGGYWLTYGQYFESTDNAYLQGDITSISPKVSGYIAKSYITDNQAVKQGDLLVKIDDRDYQAALEQAKAHLTVTEARVSTISLLSKNCNAAKFTKAESQVESAQAEYDRAVQQVARSRSLLKRNYASQDESRQHARSAKSDNGTTSTKRKLA